MIPFILQRDDSRVADSPRAIESSTRHYSNELYVASAVPSLVETCMTVEMILAEILSKDRVATRRAMIRGMGPTSR